jgi:hypothetical protein
MRLPVIICLLPALLAPGLPVITQVLPAPGDASPFSEWWAGEYVELYNAGPFTLVPDGYRLRVAGVPGPPLRSEPPGGSIPPGGYALIVPLGILARRQSLSGSALLTDGRTRLGGHGLRYRDVPGAVGQQRGSALLRHMDGQSRRDTSLQRITPGAGDLPGNGPRPVGRFPGAQQPGHPAALPSRR